MYIISFASCSSQLTVGRQHTKDTIEEAIDCAYRLSKANGATEPEDDIREEITNDMSYLSPDGEWGVFIGQAEAEDDEGEGDEGEEFTPIFTLEGEEVIHRDALGTALGVMGEFQDEVFVPSKLLLERDPYFQQACDRFVHEQDFGKCPTCGEPLQDDVCQNPECG